jgi:uncharacterized protein YyaL (SSP411 family)
MPNRLALEKSPYLLQHAGNPVNWYPWCDEAFQLAGKENKPVFLSIGYSTCHWCHVMAHESFEDEEVAKLLNEVFICIKVDREERPDIDAIYMKVCQMVTGTGGWPLTIIMTSEKKPFFAGTYFPKRSSSRMIGMIDLISEIKKAWMTRQEDLLRSSDEIIRHLKIEEEFSGGEVLNERVLEQAYHELSERFDPVFGGFGIQPKFPMPHQLSFLLRYWKRTRNQTALNIVEKTLNSMRWGGIWDQIGFGFHRYSVDREWLVPHFEKMLYDQALLALAYTEAFQATGKKEYKKTAEEIFDYAFRVLQNQGGGFYCSEDADSEGEEGKYYVWTKSEISQTLDPSDAEYICSRFGITEEGNFYEEHSGQSVGENILHLTQNSPPLFDEIRFEKIREKLFEARRKRVPPYLDDKILMDWNGLMTAALAKASFAFSRPQYADKAEEVVHFIWNKMRRASGFSHRWRDGEASVPANLNDYAFLIWGLIELYESTFKQEYLDKALELSQILVSNFWDEKQGGFYLTSHDSEEILTRTKEIYDGAVPSGNSVAACSFWRLSELIEDSSWKEKADQTARLFSKQVNGSPSHFAQFMIGFDFALAPKRLTLKGNRLKEDTRSFIHALRAGFFPNLTVLLDEVNENQGTKAYICFNNTCYPPITDPQNMLKVLEDRKTLDVREG